MKIGAQGYHAGKAWLCICVGVEPPFSKSWIRHCILLCDITPQHTLRSWVKDSITHNSTVILCSNFNGRPVC